MIDKSGRSAFRVIWSMMPKTLEQKMYFAMETDQMTIVKPTKKHSLTREPEN